VWGEESIAVLEEMLSQSLFIGPKRSDESKTKILGGGSRRTTMDFRGRKIHASLAEKKTEGHQLIDQRQRWEKNTLGEESLELLGKE